MSRRPGNGHSRHSGAGASSEFFEALADRAYEPLLQTAAGTLRFDLVDGRDVEHWYVTMDHGDVAVSHRRHAADAVVRIDKSLFEGLVTGKINAFAATLRGELVPEGDLGLLLLFQRLFPPPPRRTAAAGRT